MTTVAAGRPRRRAELPSRQLVAVTVGTTVAAVIAFVIVTAAFPIDRAIAPPFTLGSIDPIVIGLAIWIGVALATSSRSVADEGRVTIIYGVGPIVGAWALGGPAAATLVRSGPAA